MGVGGVGGSHLGRGHIADHHLSSLVHAPAPMCGARGDDEKTSYSMPYHMHCPIGLLSYVYIYILYIYIIYIYICMYAIYMFATLLYMRAL
jgi:hypothetical protein